MRPDERVDMTAGIGGGVDRATGAVGDDLEALRARLDRIDRGLLDTLRDRIDCCRQIARVKSANDVPMMQPHRIGVVQRRAAEYADEHGIDRDFMRRLYDLIIAETCRVEDLIIEGPASARS
jgi:chorismate mutase-like protein